LGGRNFCHEEAVNKQASVLLNQTGRAKQAIKAKYKPV
jgi:hypothetical protein